MSPEEKEEEDDDDDCFFLLRNMSLKYWKLFSETLRMHGAIYLPPPPNVFKTWYLVKHEDNFTFFF
jgi:hypothetical protein